MKHCSIDTMTRKIALLTLPLHSNYGGILQCYALQTVLERMGCEVTVLNRRWGSGDLTIGLFLLRCLSVIKCIFRCYVLRQKHWVVMKPWAGEYVPNVQDAYSVSARSSLTQFVDKHLHLTPPLCSSGDLRKSDASVLADAFIVGSDQVWREACTPKITDFFLGFLPNSDIRPRVAYAASFGLETVEISSGNLSKCKKLVQKFSSVSVREHSAVELAKSVLCVDAQFVLDPTLLLSAEDYRAIAKSRSSQRQGLVAYILDGNESKIRVVRDVARSLSLHVQEINLVPKGEAGALVDMLPMESWLDAFAQADFVVTDSFHGCVFSIINRKPFIAIANRERGLTRFVSLLSQLGLMDRLVFSEEEYCQKKGELLASFDYATVEQKLFQAQNVSYSFLRESLML